MFQITLNCSADTEGSSALSDRDGRSAGAEQSWDADQRGACGVAAVHSPVLTSRICSSSGMLPSAQAQVDQNKILQRMRHFLYVREINK